MKKRRIVNWIIRITLFMVILAVGTLAALVVGETETLAAVDLSQASIHALTLTPDQEHVYAAFTGGPQPTGLSRSDDGGRTWRVLGSGPGTAISALAVHPQQADWLYAGSGRAEAEETGGLWFSDNGGQSWYRFPVGLPRGGNGLVPNVTVLVLDPNHSDVLYVGTEGQGAYRYEMGPESFGQEQIGGVDLHGTYVKNIVVDPASRVYILTTEGLYVVEGESWRKLETLPDLAISLAINPLDPQILYAGTVGYGAYRSNDGGQTWQAINSGLDWQPGVILRVSAITIDPAQSDHVTLATALSMGKHLVGSGIYETFDAGQQWTKVADSDQVISQLIINEEGIYGATDHGLVRYGEPRLSISPPSQMSLYALVHPSGTQTLILVLTLVLAGLVLIGRVDWMPGLHHKPTS